MASVPRGPDGLQFDVGTLWTMVHDTHEARCALIWRPYEWELRVSVDASVLLSERCRRQAEVFSVASAWRSRLSASGWAASTADQVPGALVTMTAASVADHLLRIHVDGGTASDQPGEPGRSSREGTAATRVPQPPRVARGARERRVRTSQ